MEEGPEEEGGQVKKPGRTRDANSMLNFIRPLPTDLLVWLAKACLIEIDERLTKPQRVSTGPDVEMRLHQSGRTLR